MDVFKIFFSLKFISKETLFAPKFDSRPVDGLLNECIRHFFFPLEPKKLKKNNNNAWSQVKHRLQASILARKFDISHWLPCGADGQVITKISRMDR